MAFGLRSAALTAPSHANIATIAVTCKTRRSAEELGMLSLLDRTYSIRREGQTSLLFGCEWQRNWLAAFCREVECFGEHQAMVSFAGGGMLRWHAEGHAVEPGLGLIAHGAAKFAERDVARRVAPHEVDQTTGVGSIAF